MTVDAGTPDGWPPGDHVTVPEGETSVTHLCPLIGEYLMPCCRRSPFEVPRWHRITLDPNKVTCGLDVNDTV